MKIFNKIALSTIFIAAVGTSSCTSDFVEMNTNPNASSVASPQSLLGPTLVATINNNLNRNFRINNEFMQVTVTTTDSREFHRYELRVSESENMWRSWYTQLTNIRDIYTNAEATKQTGYQTFKGISLILDAWVSSLLTDMFGDVPYFESNLGKIGNTTPKFDAQQDIYFDLFNKLDSANVLLSKNINFPIELASTDPIYNGNAERWRKFGNSLYLRLLMRIAHKDEAKISAKIKDIVSRPKDYPIMTDNSESAILKFTNSLPYVTEFYNARDFDFNGDKGFSEFFINNLLNLKDPRIGRWATEAGIDMYAGMMSGYPKGAIPEIQSKIQLGLKTEPLLGNIMNFGELQFILAEASLKGYISNDANNYYQAGVKSAIELWGTEVDDSYFDNEAADLMESITVDDKLKKVHLQKYYTLIFTDFQQWYEHRRVGQILDLYKGPGLLNDGKMPVRLNYPIIVQSLNKQNYDDAVAKLGGDGINEKMWWQQ